MTLEHGNKWQEQLVGNRAHLQASGMRGPHYETKKLNTRAKGQRAARDIYKYIVRTSVTQY